MSASKGNKITAADFTSLKNLVKNEINRRSNPRSTGSMSGYNGSNYNYSTNPATGGKILREHVTKITQPLDAVTGNSTTPGNGAAVTASTLINAASDVAILSNKNVTSSNTGCRSSCSGLCSSGCYTNCTGSCVGSCTGSCTGSCVSTCNNTCKNTCNTTCSGTCSGSCSNGCGGSCSNDCSGGCSGCDGDCDGCQGCGGTCSSKCWESDCSGTCSVHCNDEAECHGSCDSFCGDIAFKS